MEKKSFKEGFFCIMAKWSFIFLKLFDSCFRKKEIIDKDLGFMQNVTQYLQDGKLVRNILFVRIMVGEFGWITQRKGRLDQTKDHRGKITGVHGAVCFGF